MIANVTTLHQRPNNVNVEAHIVWDKSINIKIKRCVMIANETTLHQRPCKWCRSNTSTH